VREARAVAAVDHPHIIPVYGAGEADGVLFIAMRFVASGDLRVVVGRESGLPPGRAAAFISPVASALDAAHQAGLVHRDVKPANVLVDAGAGRPEHVYLTDFGLARGLFSAGGLTRAGQFLGTPEYAAPEQINGRRVDGRADQYALACVAYTLRSPGTCRSSRWHRPVPPGRRWALAGNERSQRDLTGSRCGRGAARIALTLLPAPAVGGMPAVRLSLAFPGTPRRIRTGAQNGQP
jgi:serine/threonine protein kinase